MTLQKVLFVFDSESLNIEVFFSFLLIVQEFR